MSLIWTNLGDEFEYEIRSLLSRQEFEIQSKQQLHGISYCYRKITNEISNTEADCILFASDLIIIEISCFFVTAVKYRKEKLTNSKRRKCTANHLSCNER